MAKETSRLSIMLSGIFALSLVSSLAEARKKNFFDMLFEQQQPPQQTKPRQQMPDPWQGLNNAPVNNQAISTVGLTSNQKEAAIVSEFRTQPPSGQYISVTKREWSEEDETLYGQFIEQIGHAVRDGVCSTVKDCMRSQIANMFRYTDNPGLILYSDCADFPYITRAYFASKMGLPFSYSGGLELLQVPVASLANRQDDLAQSLIDKRLDNSPYGNIVISRAGNNIPAKPGQRKLLEDYLENMFDVVSTRTFRAGPMSPHQVPLDTYPVAINKESIRAGTILVSTGHVGSVFEVNAQGAVSFVDAHPDGSLSIKLVKPSTLDRSRPEHGLGFYRFRNIRVLGGAYDRYTGEIYGGRALPVTDAELIASGKYSLEQFFGPGSYQLPDQYVSPTAWSSSYRSTNFFDYLAMKLRGQGVWVDADQAVAKLMDSMCAEIKQRAADIDVALNEGTPMQEHPTTLPENIFSSTGTWEDQSTPSRDGRMRASVLDIAKAAVNQWQLYKTPGTGVRFRGGNNISTYRDSLRNELAAMDSKCQITYRKSDGSSKSLVFSEILSRLNKLSFDPYHCSEKRWGASGQELASCRDSDQGNIWYNAQTYMRNYQGKIMSNEKLVIRSTQPITLEMLRGGYYIDQPESSLNNLGYTKPPFMDLRGYFNSENFMRALSRGN